MLNDEHKKAIAAGVLLDQQVGEAIERLVSLISASMEALVILSPSYALQAVEQLTDQVTVEDMDAQDERNREAMEKLVDMIN